MDVMFRLWGIWIITTCIFFPFSIRDSICEVKMTPRKIAMALRKSGIVPDVIDAPPKHVLQVRYLHDKEVAFGNNMTRWETIEDPVYILYPVEQESYYTLIMTDPDCPSREHPHHREWQHLILVNILSGNWRAGFYLTDYIGILGAYEFAIHRYVFILYKQPGRNKLNFTERVLDARPIEQLRYKFSTKNFAAKYDMGYPVAINYFLSGQVPKTAPTSTTITTTTTKTTTTTSASSKTTTTASIISSRTTSTTTLSPAAAEVVVPQDSDIQSDPAVASSLA